jgi:hypothetical protein
VWGEGSSSSSSFLAQQQQLLCAAQLCVTRHFSMTALQVDDPSGIETLQQQPSPVTLQLGFAPAVCNAVVADTSVAAPAAAVYQQQRCRRPQQQQTWRQLMAQGRYRAAGTLFAH